MKPQVLDLADLAQAIGRYRAALVRHERTINLLNVFPVPDGDTGTNMLATVRAAEDALAAAPSEVRGAIARGALLGARGNSGIILAQFLGALAATFGDAPVDARVLARALARAGQAARAAVADPREGTMLSVADAAARGAAAAIGSLSSMLEACYQSAREALWRTPRELPVLARAGVVDAGGAGLLLFFGVLAGVAGARPTDALELPADVGAMLATHRSPLAGAAVPDEGVTYEVMCLVEGATDVPARLRAAWAAIGDSIAIVGAAPDWRCHVHTADPDAVLVAAASVGPVGDVRVADVFADALAGPDDGGPDDRGPDDRGPDDGGSGDDRRDGGAALRAATGGTVDHGDRGRRGSNGEGSSVEPASAALAVASGAGIVAVLRSLGADVVDGGSSMNPSMGDVATALRGTAAREVVVLVNDKDVENVARHAVATTSRSAVVVATRSVPAGVAAMVSFDPRRTAHENAEAMERVLSGVATGRVVRAVRRADLGDAIVAEGEYLAFGGPATQPEAVVGHGADLPDTLVSLVAAIRAEHHEVVTLFLGATRAGIAAHGAADAVRAAFPTLVVEELRGDQPGADVLVLLE